MLEQRAGFAAKCKWSLEKLKQSCVAAHKWIILGDDFRFSSLARFAKACRSSFNSLEVSLSAADKRLD